MTSQIHWQVKMTNDKHVPVLLEEVIDGLNIKKDGVYVDLTLGRGGHSEEILKRLDKGMLIGVDQDQTAIEESEERLSKLGKNYRLVRSNFVEIDQILQNLNVQKIDGVLMDLGVSSPQFDDISRGFTYRFDTKLDMRMDQRNALTAAKVVNNYSLEQLTRVFKEYGEEKYSYQIAKNIVKVRESKPIETTFELVDIIKMSKPMKELKKAGHPAFFQYSCFCFSAVPFPAQPRQHGANRIPAITVRPAFLCASVFPSLLYSVLHCGIFLAKVEKLSVVDVSLGTRNNDRLQTSRIDIYISVMYAGTQIFVKRHPAHHLLVFLGNITV